MKTAREECHSQTIKYIAKGFYLTPRALFHKLGGDDEAMEGVGKYIEKVAELGGHWIRKHWGTEMTEVF